MTLEEFKAAFRDRLGSTDITRVKEDVLPFLNNPDELDIWSNDYFLQLADMMKILLPFLARRAMTSSGFSLMNLMSNMVLSPVFVYNLFTIILRKSRFRRCV